MRPFILAASLVPAFAFAQAPKTATDAAPAPQKAERLFEMGVELFGSVNGNFITEPSGAEKIIPTPNGLRADMPYPGFGGVGGGAGVSFTGMYMGIIGFELQLSYLNDGAEGEVNGQNFKFSQTALHMPLHLRLAMPAESVRPFLFGGVEFVFPGETTIEEKPFFGGDIKMAADTYYAWSFGLGFEFLLPVEGHDLRIPFKLKASHNPNVGDNAEDRMRLTGTGNDPSTWAWEVDTELEWQAAVQLGLAYYFL